VRSGGQGRRVRPALVMIVSLHFLMPLKRGYEAVNQHDFSPNENAGFTMLTKKQRIVEIRWN
jgi:hypothetical protein